MATFGLRINRGPTLNLSGIFKAAMPDPDLAIKAALANSTIWGQEHQNQLYDQQREYARQQAAQEAQKTGDLQELARRRSGAVSGLERGLVGAIPKAKNQPVPVELARIAGPVDGVPVSAPPAIVDQQFYDDQVAAAKARASLMPYIVESANDLTSAYGKDIGQETLAAGLTPGGPAAVGLTPDKLRLAATLTGQMPTMSTALTKDDTVGADMATRQAVQTAAGKLPYDITLEKEKAVAKAQADLAANPLGASGSGPAAYLLAMLTAKEKTPAGLTPEEQQVKIQTQAIVDKANAITPGKDAPIFLPGPEGMKRVAGPEENASTPAYPGDSVAAGNKNIILDTARDMAKGLPVDPNKYRIAFGDLWPEKQTVVTLPDGQKQIIAPTPAQAGWPTPDAVDAYMQQRAPGGSTLQGGAALPGMGIIQPAVLGTKTTGELPLLAKTVPPATERQGKDQTFAQGMQTAAIDLNTFDETNLPGVLEASQIVKDMAVDTDPTLISATLNNMSRQAILSPEAKAYEQAIAAWTSFDLYEFSGAQITYGEWVKQQLAMAPLYGDKNPGLLKKAQLRSNILRGFAKNGWANDKASYDEWVENTRRRGLDLTYGLGAEPPITLGPRAVAPAAPRAVDPNAPKKIAPKGVRPQGYESLSEEQWRAMYDELPPEAQAQFDALAGQQ